MPTPLDPRKKPTSVKIHVSNGAGVDVTWADGHASHYEFAYLREECPCATCNDAREKKASLGEAASAFKSASPTDTPPASTATTISATSAPAPSVPKPSAVQLARTFWGFAGMSN